MAIWLYVMYLNDWNDQSVFHFSLLIDN